MKPNPGSPAALSLGCTCPVLDNAHGRGYMGGVRDERGRVVFVRVVGCPVHGVEDERLDGKAVAAE